jgi:hypothetical protein
MLDLFQTNSPTKKLPHSADFKPFTNNHSANDAPKFEPSNNNKFTTFTKHSSLDEDLPPSMGKLQDRTYDMKYNSSSKTEGKGPLSNKGSFEDRNSSEDVVQFRLSRQQPSTQGQSPGEISSENSQSQNSEKAKTPVLNYKSRMNVPVSFQNKQISENNEDTSQNSENFSDGYRQENQNSENETKPPTSPQRKCWNTEAAVNSEPCIAVSESNNYILDQKDDKMAAKAETPEGAVVVDTQINHGQVVETRNHYRVGSTSPGEDVEADMSDATRSPEEGVLPDEEDDTPKKGLALFIGEENTISNSDVSKHRKKRKSPPIAELG